MLKAALLCSAICTAFVVGDRTSPATQDKSTELAQPVSLDDVLKSFVGKKCHATRFNSGHWYLSFRKTAAKTESQYKFEMLGVDFIRLSNKGGKLHVPFSSVAQIDTD